MRIRIKSEEHDLNLVFPTGLLTGKFAMRMVRKYGRKYAAGAMENIPPQALDAICAEIRRIKEKHGKWELADIRSADGEEINITL